MLGYDHKSIKWVKEPSYRKCEAPFRMFLDFMQLLIEDVIENDAFFPMHGEGDLTLQVRQIGPEEFKGYRQKGAFQDIDFLATNFKGVEVAVMRGLFKKVTIFLNQALKKKLRDYANSGRVYWGRKQRDYWYYVDQLMQTYPEIERESLGRIIRVGLSRLGGLARHGYPIYLQKGFFTCVFNRVPLAHARAAKFLKNIYKKAIKLHTYKKKHGGFLYAFKEEARVIQTNSLHVLRLRPSKGTIYRKPSTEWIPGVRFNSADYSLEGWEFVEEHTPPKMSEARLIFNDFKKWLYSRK